MKPRVAFVTSHPIQYQVPVFRCLTERDNIDLTVLFAQIPDAAAQGDGFGVDFEWDIPLLEGYAYEVLENVAKEPSVTRFGGCDTPGIGRLIRERKFDAVIVNGWVVKTCIQALVACRLSRIPCIVRGEANDLTVRPWWKRKLQGLLVRQFSAHLFIGTRNREFYLARGVRESQLFSAPYCVDNDRFARSLEWDKSECRDFFGLPHEPTVFLFSGKLEPKKRPMDFIEAAALASKNGVNLHCLIVGDGELRDSLETRAAELGLPATFAGFLNQTDIPRAYRAADCLVLPSDAGETWGLVVNEAMACGCPAIVSDMVGCCSDLVEPDAPARKFRCGDVDALRRSLAGHQSRLVENHDQAYRVGLFSPNNAAVGAELAVSAAVDSNQMP